MNNNNFFSKITSFVLGQNNSKYSQKRISRPLNKYSQRELLRIESEIGAEIFGVLPKGRRREFFCLDNKTWIWHEEWLDEKSKLQHITTKYVVRDNKILKSRPGVHYTEVTGEELKNLHDAVKIYHERVVRDIYSAD